MERLKELASTFFYLGYSPVASGTAGTLGAMGIAFLFLLLPENVSYGVACIAAAVIFFILGVPLGHWAERRYGKKDPGPFVLDEVMGYFVPLGMFLEERPGTDDLLVAFFLFRLFDVAKPTPARKLEKLVGGWGIMLDDLVAGILALLGLMVYHAVRGNPNF